MRLGARGGQVHEVMGEVTPDRMTPRADPMGRETLEGWRGSSGLGIATLGEPEETLGKRDVLEDQGCGLGSDSGWRGGS